MQGRVGQGGRDLYFLLEALVIAFEQAVLDLVTVAVVLLVVNQLGKEEGMRDIVVHQDLGENLAAEGAEEESLQSLGKLAKCDIVWGKVGREPETVKDRVVGFRLFDIVLPLVLLLRVQFLHGRGQGRERFGEEVILVKQAARGEERVLDRVEVSVRSLLVGDQDLGVKVELERWDMSVSRRPRV